MEPTIPTATSPSRRTTGAATRARILAATNELFYADGIRATSADRIIDKVGITKVTFYRHFHTKSDLVVAYLQGQAETERAWLEGLIDPADPVGTLRAFAAGIGRLSCEPWFRGCAFINAAAEFPDPDDPVRAVVTAHRQWMLDKLTDLARQAGVGDPAAAGRQLMVIRDGAMINGYLGESAQVADATAAAFTAVLAAG